MAPERSAAAQSHCERCGAGEALSRGGQNQTGATAGTPSLDATPLHTEARLNFFIECGSLEHSEKGVRHHHWLSKSHSGLLRIQSAPNRLAPKGWRRSGASARAPTAMQTSSNISAPVHVLEGRHPNQALVRQYPERPRVHRRADPARIRADVRRHLWAAAPLVPGQARHLWGYVI